MIIVVLVFAVLLIIGCPIFSVLGLAGISHLFVMGNDSYFNIVTQKVFAGMSVSSLTCIPFFIMAGELSAAKARLKLMLILSQYGPDGRPDPAEVARYFEHSM